MVKLESLTSTLVVALVILALSGTFFILKRAERTLPGSETKCITDADCVPATCCHPDSCVNVKYAPDCKNIICTLECRLGTMDCGGGRCVCINNQCKVKLG